MRSILALALAGLILAANAPGMFTETPVCASVDGAKAVLAKASRLPGSMWRKAKPKVDSPSCCGSATCPMHAHGCGQTAACAMDAAYGPDAIIASADKGGNDTRLCAPSCGRDGAREAPGLPDPGTIDTGGKPAPVLAQSGRVHCSPATNSTRNTDPAVPPPRS